MVKIITALEAQFIEEVLVDAYEEITQLEDGDTTDVLSRIKEAHKILAACPPADLEEIINDE